MAPVTMSKIATVTVGSGGTANIEFTNIPQIYTDLFLVCSIRTTRASVVDGISVIFNNTSTGSSNRELYGSGSGTGSGADPSGSYIGYVNGNNATANVFGNSSLYIPNYTMSNHKSSSGDSVSENNATAGYQSLEANLWSNSSAINKVTLNSYTGSTIMQHSTATLYGIKSAATGAKATGGEISQIGNYYIHTFNSTGTFTPLENLNVEYLVVAGGGGGGYDQGGGGGAGGLLSGITSLSATGYTVTVGSGGNGSSGGASKGSSGSNSSLSTIAVATGGGGGGSISNRGGLSGGSGGGGGSDNSGGASIGGSGTSGQGNAGGNGCPSASDPRGGGGGGGAGAVGSTGKNTSNHGGNGGIGVQSSISGASTYYAGGGGAGSGGTNSVGGTGGLGGGGNGANNNASNNTAGTANTGGGGGGSHTASNGSAGGSGVVIIRYSI